MRINDRGPFVEGRVIDLSYTGAQTLEMLGKGTAKVVVEATLPPAEERVLPSRGPSPSRSGHLPKRNAERFQRDLKPKYSQVHMVLWESNQRRIHRVRLGAFRSEVEARELLGDIEKG